MERDKTDIEVAIEYIIKRLDEAKSHCMIDNLTDALASLIKARNDEQDGHK